MATQIYVNLPVKSLQRAIDFFTGLGFTFNQEFTDDKATCMVIDENIYVMLLVEPFFQGFTPKAICDAHRSTEVLVCISRESREAVNRMVEKAIAGGGKAPNPPKDHGFMYQHGFEDLDGHLWELVYMEPKTST